MKFLAWLLLSKGLEMTGICMSRVGHTHCAIGALSGLQSFRTRTGSHVVLVSLSCSQDQLYGVISRATRWIDVLADDDDVQESLALAVYHVHVHRFK